VGSTVEVLDWYDGQSEDELASVPAGDLCRRKATVSNPISGIWQRLHYPTRSVNLRVIPHLRCTFVAGLEPIPNLRGQCFLVRPEWRRGRGPLSARALFLTVPSFGKKKRRDRCQCIYFDSKAVARMQLPCQCMRITEDNVVEPRCRMTGTTRHFGVRASVPKWILRTEDKNGGAENGRAVQILCKTKTTCLCMLAFSMFMFILQTLLAPHVLVSSRDAIAVPVQASHGRLGVYVALHFGRTLLHTTEPRPKSQCLRWTLIAGQYSERRRLRPRTSSFLLSTTTSRGERIRSRGMAA